jgi:hypothetical protein
MCNCDEEYLQEQITVVQNKLELLLLGSKSARPDIGSKVRVSHREFTITGEITDIDYEYGSLRIKKDDGEVSPDIYFSSIKTLVIL